MTKTFYKEPLNYLFAGILTAFCFVLTVDSANVSAQMTAAIERCMNVIIPSLFAFMAVSNILVASGSYRYVSKPFFIISKYLLGMPAHLFFVFLMGNFAGYPMGVKLLSDMVRSGNISKKTAETMSCFCCCGGPAFYVGTVGLGIFGSVKIGLGIFLSIICANLISAAFLCRITKLSAQKHEPPVKFDSQILTNSVLNAGKSLFTICAMILFFSAFMSVMESAGLFWYIKNLFGLNENSLILIRSLFEITSITQLQNTPFVYLPQIAALCSFGGLCVIMQISAVNSNTLSLKRFYMSRPLNAFLSAVVFSCIKNHFIPSAVETAYSDHKYLVKINNFVPSVCLILMILLLKYKKRLVFSKQM